MIILNILSWILILFLLILAAVLFFPLYYKAEGKIGAHNEVSGKAGWFPFIRIFYNYTPGKSEFIIKLGPFKISTDGLFTEKPKKKIKEDKEDKQKFKILNVGSLLKDTDNKVFPLTKTLIKKICGKILPRKFSLNGIIGLGDPFATVKFIGMYEAVSCAAGFRDKIRIQGDYGEARLKLDFKLSGYFTIASLTWSVIWFILQKPVRKTFFKKNKKT